MSCWVIDRKLKSLGRTKSKVAGHKEKQFDYDVVLDYVNLVLVKSFVGASLRLVIIMFKNHWTMLFG